MASWPPLLRADASAAMLNFEIADHPVYHGLELQWFDDANYQIGAGTGTWAETDITDALLEISDDGVHAAALFTDVDGRRIEVRIDDRDGRRRRRGGLLAPVSAAIESPRSLFLVWLPAFDLVRTGGHPPRGRLAAGPCSRRCRRGRCGRRHRPAGVPPPLSDLTALPDGARRDGSWSVSADAERLTGGRWFAERDGDAEQRAHPQDRACPGRVDSMNGAQLSLRGDSAGKPAGECRWRLCG